MGLGVEECVKGSAGGGPFLSFLFVKNFSWMSEKNWARPLPAVWETM